MATFKTAGNGGQGKEKKKVLMQHEEAIRSGTAGGRIKGSQLISLNNFVLSFRPTPAAD